MAHKCKDDMVVSLWKIPSPSISAHPTPKPINRLAYLQMIQMYLWASNVSIRCYPLIFDCYSTTLIPAFTRKYLFNLSSQVKLTCAAIRICWISIHVQMYFSHLYHCMEKLRYMYICRHLHHICLILMYNVHQYIISIYCK